MDCLRNTLCYPVSQNPKKGITYTWILIMILVTALFFAACFMASQLHNGLASDQSAGFSGVWCSLVAIGVSIGGTVIMRKYQSALAIGVFLGIIVVMNFQMLILFAIALSHQNQSDEYSSEVSQDSRGSQQAVAGISFLMCFVYGVFASMLAIFRSDIIRSENYANEEHGRMSFNRI